MSQQATWLSRVFNVYIHAQTTWNNVGGIYIFAGISPYGHWVPLYIGQADSFRSRIPSHEQWNPAVRLGATHVHAAVVPAAIRGSVERELIAMFQPKLNVQLR